MAVSLTADEMSRAKKIAAMLSASTDGERLNALAMLQKIADSKKVRIDELLLALGGGSSSSAPPRQPSGYDPFKWDPRDNWQPRPNRTDAREGADYAYSDFSFKDKSTPESDRVFAEAIKREHERRAKARQQREEMERRTQEDILRAKQTSTNNALKARLDVMQGIPESRLSAWEIDFRYSILDKALSPFWTPSEKQNVIINKIIEKAL